MEYKGPFESSDVVQVVGIRPIYLNKFVERNLYGISPSARAGEGRGSRRWFSLDDILGIALVWWLFEAGLRTEVIKRILRELGKTVKADAKRAASVLNESATEFLLISRDPRLAGNKKEWTPQIVAAADFASISARLTEIDHNSFYILPVGKLYGDLAVKLKEHISAI